MSAGPGCEHPATAIATVAATRIQRAVGLDAARGGSRAAGHIDEIDVHGVRWGLHRAPPNSRGRQAHHVVADDVVVTAAMDRATPAWVDHVARGRSVPTERLSWTAPGGPEVVSLVLQNVTVPSFRAVSAASLPAVRIGLAYEAAILRVHETNAVGSAGDELEVEFDLETPA